MNRPRDQLLARAGFAGDQHGSVGRGHLFDRFQRAPERRRVADYLLELRDPAELVAQRYVLGFQLISQSGDLLVGQGVGDGHSDRARNILQDRHLFGREWVRLSAREYQDADALPSRQQRDRGVCANPHGGQFEFVREPFVFFQKIVADVGLRGLFDFFEFGPGVWNELLFRHVWMRRVFRPHPLRYVVNALIFEFGFAHDMHRPGRSLPRFWRNDRYAEEGDYGNEYLSHRGQYSIKFPLRIDRLPGLQYERMPTLLARRFNAARFLYGSI